MQSDQNYNKTEEEYTLRMLNEALTGKRYPVTPKLWEELDKKAKERDKQKNK
jgi:hypothetical protein